MLIYVTSQTAAYDIVFANAVVGVQTSLST